MALRCTLMIASRSHGLTQSTVRITSFNSTAFVPTLLSSRCYVAGQKPLTDEERQRRHEERKARAAERFRLRYHSDPEFREKHNQRCRNHKAIPEHREKRLLGLREKYANDPQFREQHTLHATKQNLELKSKLEKDPKAYQLHRDQTAKRCNALYHGNAGFRWSIILATRLKDTPRHCDEVVWALHKPVLYPAKMNHTCATCDRKRYGGLKLWWQRKNDPKKYDCMRCFGADREASTPIYAPPEFPPLPDRGPMGRPRNHDEKRDGTSGTGATT